MQTLNIEKLGDDISQTGKMNINVLEAHIYKL